jgi:hypothetical protein
MVKDLYKGQFNWQGDTHHLFRWAVSEQHAKLLMLKALAKRLGMSEYALRNYFAGQKDNFHIKKEVD